LLALRACAGDAPRLSRTRLAQAHLGLAQWLLQATGIKLSNRIWINVALKSLRPMSRFVRLLVL